MPSPLSTTWRSRFETLGAEIDARIPGGAPQEGPRGVSLTQYYTATRSTASSPTRATRSTGSSPATRIRRAPQLRGVHPRRRCARDGLVDVRVGPRARVRRQGPSRSGSGRTSFRVWVFTTDSSRSSRMRRSSSRSVTSRPCMRRWSSAAGGKNVWIVGGGDLVGQFADVGLLDEVIVYIAPVTLGAGAPLLAAPVELRLAEPAPEPRLRAARYSVVRAND